MDGSKMDGSNYVKQVSQVLLEIGAKAILVDSVNYDGRPCCLKKECYPTDCCRFVFSSFLWFAGREAPGLFGFQFFPKLSFNRRIGGLAQTAQDQFSYALGLPHLDAALQRP